MKIVERPTITNEKQLRVFAKRWVPWWRDRLGLRDWHIDVQLCGTTELGDSYGECMPNFSKRTATIRFLVPSPREQIWEKFDAEETVVHELLHLVFGTAGVGLEDYDTGKMSLSALVEQQINALASILVKLRRGSRR